MKPKIKIDNGEIYPKFNSSNIDIDKITELISFIPLYKHTEPQTKETINELWVQNITQIIRNVMQNEVRAHLECYRKQFEQFNKELIHIRQYEKELYEEWKKLFDTTEKISQFEEKIVQLDQKYNTLLDVLKEHKETWAKGLTK
jgi:DNA repair ATPase RecN